MITILYLYFTYIIIRYNVKYLIVIKLNRVSKLFVICDYLVRYSLKIHEHELVHLQQSEDGEPRKSYNLTTIFIENTPHFILFAACVQQLIHSPSARYFPDASNCGCLSNELRLTNTLAIAIRSRTVLHPHDRFNCHNHQKIMLC